MDIKISEKGGFTGTELNELFATNHWDIADVERLESSVKNSWYWVTARAMSGQIIGFVQAISDGIRHVYILKMIVHPDFRHRRIATRIMELLMNEIKNRKMLPTLVATQGHASFYEQFGFRTEWNGLTAMCIR